MKIYHRIRNWIANLLGYRQGLVFRNGCPIGVRVGFKLIRHGTVAGSAPQVAHAVTEGKVKPGQILEKGEADGLVRPTDTGPPVYASIINKEAFMEVFNKVCHRQAEKDILGCKDRFRVTKVRANKSGDEFIIFTLWAEPPVDLSPIFLFKIEHGDLNLYQISDMENWQPGHPYPSKRLDKIPEIGDVIVIESVEGLGHVPLEKLFK